LRVAVIAVTSGAGKKEARIAVIAITTVTDEKELRIAVIAVISVTDEKELRIAVIAVMSVTDEKELRIAVIAVMAVTSVARCVQPAAEGCLSDEAAGGQGAWRRSITLVCAVIVLLGSRSLVGAAVLVPGAGVRLGGRGWKSANFRPKSAIPFKRNLVLT
jgi:hypothetical protein